MYSQAETNNAEAELIEAMAGFSQDPFEWVLFAFPWGSADLSGFDGPDAWQAEELRAIGERLRSGADVGVVIQDAVASGHGVGKSALVAWLILWAMSTFTDCRGVITANTEAQLKTKTWSELSKWHRMCICRHWFTLTATALYSASADHEKTWRIDMVVWSERNTEAFAGLHNKGKRILLIFDEGSAIPDVIWEVSEGALTDEGTEIIWAAFGNPTRNTGRFKDCFGKLKHRWETRQVDSRTSKFTNKPQLQKWIDDYGIDSDFVKVRIRGMFPAMSARQFISLKDIDAAYGKELHSQQYAFAPKILSCDPAWEGDDELVIGMRQGLLFKVLRVIPKNDNDIHIASLLASIEDEEKADAVFIDGGFGTGIVSAGKTMGRNWRLVWFGGESIDPGCLNKRAEMANSVKQWLKSGGCIPKDQTLYDELCGEELAPRFDGKIQLEPKDAFKKRVGWSPGRLDALRLTFAQPVTKKSDEEKLWQSMASSPQPESRYWHGKRT